MKNISNLYEDIRKIKNQLESIVTYLKFNQCNEINFFKRYQKINFTTQVDSSLAEILDLLENYTAHKYEKNYDYRNLL